MYVYSFIWSKRANISMKFMQYSLVCFSQAGYLIGNETTGRTVVVDLRRDIDEDAAPQALTLDETDAEFASATMPSMESSGELGYFDALTDDGLRHALNKPWSDPDRGRMLQQLGALMSLLPPPPARVLDLGCGTGWLSWILQSSGYHVTGVDIAPRAVELAQAYVAQMAMPDHIEVGDYRGRQGAQAGRRVVDLRARPRSRRGVSRRGRKVRCHRARYAGRPNPQGGRGSRPRARGDIVACRRVGFAPVWLVGQAAYLAFVAPESFTAANCQAVHHERGQAPRQRHRRHATARGVTPGGRCTCNLGCSRRRS